MFEQAFSDFSEEDQKFLEHQEFLRKNRYYNETYLFGILCNEIDIKEIN